MRKPALYILGDDLFQGFLCLRINRNLPPADNAPDGREAGQGILSARLTIETGKTDARLQKHWSMRAFLTRRHLSVKRSVPHLSSF